MPALRGPRRTRPSARALTTHRVLGCPPAGGAACFCKEIFRGPQVALLPLPTRKAAGLALALALPSRLPAAAEELGVGPAQGCTRPQE